MITCCSLCPFKPVMTKTKGWLLLTNKTHEPSMRAEAWGRSVCGQGPVNTKYCISNSYEQREPEKQRGRWQMFAAGQCHCLGLAERERAVTMARPYSRLEPHERILIFRARVRSVTVNTRIHLIFGSQLILLFPRHLETFYTFITHHMQIEWFLYSREFPLTR